MSNSDNKRTAPWWAGEDVVRLAGVPALMPRRADGKTISLSVVYQWCQAGLHGVRLRRFKAGGGYATTRQEVERWQAALTDLAETGV